MIPISHSRTSDISEVNLEAITKLAETLAASCGKEAESVPGLLFSAALHAAMKHDAYVELSLMAEEIQPSLALLARLERGGAS